MIIRRDKDTFIPQVPSDIEKKAQEAFTYQTMQQEYEAIFKNKKESLQYLIENHESFTIDKGVGFQTRFGKITFQSYRPNIKVNIDQLAALIENGSVSLISILNACNFSNQTDLERALGSTNFAKIVTVAPGKEGLTLRADAVWKADLIEKLGTAELYDLSDDNEVEK